MLYYKGNNFKIFTNKTSTCLFVILQRTKSVFRNRIIYHSFNSNDKNNKKTLQSNVNHPLADGCIGNIFNMSVWGVSLYGWVHVVQVSTCNMSMWGGRTRGQGPADWGPSWTSLNIPGDVRPRTGGGGAVWGPPPSTDWQPRFKTLPSHDFVGGR